MKTATIYTNGKIKFTLENYGKTAGVCEVHGIAIHSVVSQLKKRAMHVSGEVHYVFGIGNRLALSRQSFKRGQEVGSFTIG